jgi:molecular chaperone IbpA
MNNLARYTAADLPALMDRITRNSIGMDEYFDRLFNLHETTTNYPPYNLVQVNNVESHLEIALAGFKKKCFHGVWKTFCRRTKRRYRVGEDVCPQGIG